MTRGFVTIATGKEQYYRIARNLLWSYRYFSKDPVPFALICDRENEYTKEFDRIILMEHPAKSYLDKLELPRLIPYDETIFVDADTLAYRDLNDFWAAFEDATDFSVFGFDYPADYDGPVDPWFRKQDVAEYGERISSIPEFIGGVYYLRRTLPDTFYETSQRILKNYYRYKFRQFEDPCDEAVYALTMAVQGCRTAGEKSPACCFYPHAVRFRADIRKGSTWYDNRYYPDRKPESGAYSVHWGTGNTWSPVYRIEEYKIRRMRKGHIPSDAEVFFVSLYYRLRKKAGGILRHAGLRK